MKPGLRHTSRCIIWVHAFCKQFVCARELVLPQTEVESLGLTNLVVGTPDYSAPSLRKVKVHVCVLQAALRHGHQLIGSFTDVCRVFNGSVESGQGSLCPLQCRAWTKLCGGGLPTDPALPVPLSHHRLFAIHKTQTGPTMGSGTCMFGPG